MKFEILNGKIWLILFIKINGALFNPESPFTISHSPSESKLLPSQKYFTLSRNRIFKVNSKSGICFPKKITITRNAAVH